MSQQKALKNEGYQTSPSYRGGIHVKEKALPESAKEKTITDGFGPKCTESFEKLDLSGCLEKMLLDMSLLDSMKFSPIWKEKTTPQGRLYYRLAYSAQIMKDTGFSLLPTPAASQLFKPIRPLAPSERNGTHGTMTCAALGNIYPELIGKYINPQYAEWMMGLPIGWSEINQDFMQLGIW